MILPGQLPSVIFLCSMFSLPQSKQKYPSLPEPIKSPPNLITSPKYLFSAAQMSPKYRVYTKRKEYPVATCRYLWNPVYLFCIYPLFTHPPPQLLQTRACAMTKFLEF